MVGQKSKLAVLLGQLSKEERNAVMVDLHCDGMSYRQIGKLFNLDHKSVMSAVHKSPGEHTPPVTVVGRDGKSYPASRSGSRGEVEATARGDDETSTEVQASKDERDDMTNNGQATVVEDQAGAGGVLYVVIGGGRTGRYRQGDILNSADHAQEEMDCYASKLMPKEECLALLADKEKEERRKAEAAKPVPRPYQPPKDRAEAIRWYIWHDRPIGKTIG
jgi:hypothetical protein